jgi:hypothetical protein
MSQQQESSRGDGRSSAPPQMPAEPKPPFAKQRQDAPGIESELKPRPRFEAPLYKAAGKLEGRPTPRKHAARSKAKAAAA